MITRAEKIRCVARELALRKNVYAKRVASGQMSKSVAEHELAVMAAILEDYQDADDIEEGCS